MEMEIMHHVHTRVHTIIETRRDTRQSNNLTSLPPTLNPCDPLAPLTPLTSAHDPLITLTCHPFISGRIAKPTYLGQRVYGI
jgi:hypothetical protein